MSKIVLQVNGDNGAVVENMENLSSSFFKDAYYDAFFLTEKIIKENQEYEKNVATQERLYNTITFIGERGSGKTSVMRSFLEMLQNPDPEIFQKFLSEYTSKESKGFVEGSSEIAKTEFVCIDCIDASLLEENEDIFGAILAKMLQKFNHTWEGRVDKRNLKARYEILESFEEIYRTIKHLNRSKGEENWHGESYVQDLKELYSSLDLRDIFQKFLPKYLETVSERKKTFSNRYLVVAVDDLDMNEKNGYNMLEQLHRYFMIPQVILCLAVSRKELQMLVQKQYEKTYSNTEILEHRYLEKVIPVSQRIYMPEVINQKVVVEVDGEQRSVKEAILRKIARTTHVYYDGYGLKTHFYEVGNLRTLNNLFYMLSRMSEEQMEINEQSSRYLEILELNISRLRYDVINRMAAERLNDEQEAIFRNMYETNVTRQGIVCLERAEKISQTMRKETELEDASEYAYGELLRVIHVVRKWKTEYKPLMECMQALLSIEMTWLYENLKCNQDEKERKKARNNFNSCLGTSVGGQIGNKLIPYIKRGKSNIRVGYKIIGDIKADIITEYTETAFDEQNCEQALSEIVKTIEMVFQMVAFRDIQNINLKFEMPKEEIQTETDDVFEDEYEKKEDEKINIKFDAQDIMFDIFGFVVNGLNYEQYFQNIGEKIYEMLKPVMNQGNIEQERFKKLIEEFSTKKEYDEWKEKYGYLALPVHSTDIMYNLLKRTERDARKQFPKSISKEEFYEYLKKCFEILEVNIKNQENIYIKTPEADFVYENWTEAFLECPFVKFILNENDEGLFLSFVAKFVDGVLGEEHIDDIMKSIDMDT